MSYITRIFSEVLRERKGHHKMQMTLQVKKRLRHRIKNGYDIKENTMRRYLQSAGIYISEAGYTEKDMHNLLKFYQKQSEASRTLGPAYVLEKWKASLAG
jgi:hypothetical protein